MDPPAATPSPTEGGKFGAIVGSVRVSRFLTELVLFPTGPLVLGFRLR